MEIANFIAKWRSAQGSEESNRVSFLIELCDVLGVPRPNPAQGDPTQDLFVFEREVTLLHEGKRRSVGRIDLYKHECFVLEAKQGSEAGCPKVGAARRETPRWTMVMQEALGQALRYARMLEVPPPFLIVCDVGFCFELYASFDGTSAYRPFPDVESRRVYLGDLARHADLLRTVFLDPRSLDPSRHKLEVTREVAAHVAELARDLRSQGHHSEAVAVFLKRCLFTMFAEDVGLLPESVFSSHLENYWIPHPPAFLEGIRQLWLAMRDGGTVFPGIEVRRFGGGLFLDPRPVRLDQEQLERLLEAARCDWSDVDPAIFGTLLEQALDPAERRRLGAHFTPRSFVERLIGPTIEEPLRQAWDVVKAQVRDLMARGKLQQAVAAVRAFHGELCAVQVLDPACGTGNFLYVALEVLKGLEAEVLAKLSALGAPPQEHLALQGHTVTPDQFYGIEKKRWAREIAELVLWIGYLQWQVRTSGVRDLPDPVLRRSATFEHRDALLEVDREEFVTDCRGVVEAEWDRRTMRPHRVTGELIPDEEATICRTRCIGPRPARWPEATFIVGNPPFIGNKRMRSVLGDAYVDALRSVYPDVPASADYVMYWWAKAARLVRLGATRRFGLITTNSIAQVFNRRVVERELVAEPPLSLVFALPDHPWVDTVDGADVRIAMTVGVAGRRDGLLLHVIDEETGEGGLPRVEMAGRRGRIRADLSVGPDVAAAVSLRGNAGICGQGVKVVGDGFFIDDPPWPPIDSPATGQPIVRRIVGARDVLGGRPGRWVIDFFGLSEAEAEELHPEAFQRVLTTVKPIRDQNRRRSIRELWWRFAWERPVLRRALGGLARYIVTPSTSRHRLFVRVDATVLWDGSLFAIASDDPVLLGVLSSRVHRVWSLAAGGRIGVGNDPTWTNTTCFEPFPFPVAERAPGPPAVAQEEVSRVMLEIEEHRDRLAEEHPNLDLTSIYNVVDAVRVGQALNPVERMVHDRALATLLARLHDRLDRAVLAAYGWPTSLEDEEVLQHLVDLNRSRQEEEEAGRIRWLRPDLQALDTPRDIAPSLPFPVPGVPSEGTLARRPPWPPGFPEQVAVVRDLLGVAPYTWSHEAVARHFHRARRKQVKRVLETLVALGLAVDFDTPDGKRWQLVLRHSA